MFITTTIRGTTPLLLNAFSDEAALQATNGARGSYGGDKGTPRDQAATKLYYGMDGATLVVPGPNVMRCFVDGGVYHKIGKKQVTTKESSLLYGCSTMETLEAPIIHAEDWQVDIRPIVNPSTKGRRLAYRPRFDDWELTVQLELDTTIMGVNLLRAIIDDAGKRVGLGDFRPAKKGPFGKFVVVHWHQEEIARAAA
jgi:hypothetical protein